MLLPILNLKDQTFCIEIKSAQLLFMQLSNLSCTPFRQKAVFRPCEAAKKGREKNLVRDPQLQENQSRAVFSQLEGRDSGLWWGCKEITLRNNLLPLQPFSPSDWQHHLLTSRKKHFFAHSGHPPILFQIVVLLKMLAMLASLVSSKVYLLLCSCPLKTHQCLFHWLVGTQQKLEISLNLFNLSL